MLYPYMKLDGFKKDSMKVKGDGGKCIFYIELVWELF